MPSSPSVSELLEVAQGTAVAAGHLACEKWYQPREINSKGFRDLVTDADFAVQKLITNRIRAYFPDHGFLTEEDDSDLPTEGDIIWIVDPIDGTTNYSRQQPNFVVSIAAARPTETGYEPVAGAVYDPTRNELFSGGQGLGATLQAGERSQRMQVSPVTELSEAIISLDWSSSQNQRHTTLGILEHFGRETFTMRAIGSATMAMVWVAAGRLDAYYNLNLKPWDIAAAAILLLEAGGTYSNVDGGPLDWSVSGSDCLMSNGRIHQPLLQLIHPDKP
ncbi:MAG TPA: inositol monophosphatase [Chloroflexi bacterium]|nr:inositol monophosphatase [Chloroflexota bacterium]